MRLQSGSSCEETWSRGALWKAWSLNGVLRAVAWSASGYYWPTGSSKDRNKPRFRTNHLIILALGAPGRALQ